MYRYARQGLTKSNRRTCTIALLNPQRTDRVPRIRATLPSVQMPVAFGRQLALEGCDCVVVVAACEADETSQPVKGHGTEPRPARRLIELTRDPEHELALGLAERSRSSPHPT